jgi:two-component system, cell cycle sensor histidine kinase and response regulator CckA
VGLRSSRRRRQEGAGPRVPDEGDVRSPVPSNDPGELVLRTTPDGGRYTYISPNARSILGYEPEELLAQPPLQGVHPDDLTRAKMTGDRLAAGTDQQTVLLRTRHADGHDVWLEARIATVRDPDTGEVLEAEATARDVTSHVATERALRQRVDAEALIGDVSRELLTATAEEIDEIVVRSLERAARFVGAERATLVMLSDDDAWAVRTHQWETDAEFEIGDPRVAIETIPWLIEQCRLGKIVFARSLDDLPPRAHVERATLDSKGVRSVACVPITSGDHLTGGLAFNWRTREADDCSAALSTLAVLVDVLVVALDRKQAERALRESEERFRALVQHGSDMITVLDAEGRVFYASPSAGSILGWDEDEYLGLSTFHLLHPDDRERVRQVFADAITRPGSTQPIQSRMQHKNGGYRLLESIATNLLDDPAVRGLVINSRDITERRQLEDELLQSQKMEAVGRLAGGIAHDFNNLLTAIGGYTALLLEEHPEDDAIRADLAEIEQAATRGAALVDQLLSFSRRKMLMPTTLDLNEVVESTRGLLSRVIGADVELVTRLARNLDGVRADRTQIEQVLLNLAVNARDAMPVGGRLDIETANVTLRAQDVAGHIGAMIGPHVLLSVRDTGTGMDRETQAQVFEPFFTTKDVGEGSGLGLSTAYGIVTQAGGHIAVDSRLGAGTTFRVYLPADTRDVAAATPIEHDAAPRTGRETILVVEDEPAVRRLARDVLARLGYDVLVAPDGRDALKVADRCRRPIDLLVSDMVLPHLRGVEVADRLRARQPGLRVLYISGYTETAIVHDGQLDPGVDFLAKPFRPVDLAERVREVLDA